MKSGSLHAPPQPPPPHPTPPRALQLEAEAYSLWMAGSVLLEKESDWEGALARFLKARWAAGRRAARPVLQPLLVAAPQPALVCGAAAGMPCPGAAAGISS